MTTFEVGKTYYYTAYYVNKLEVVKKTKCFVWIKNKYDKIEKKKIRYTDNNEEYIFHIYNRVRLYSSCRWNRYWKIEKHEEGYEIIIKPDYTKYYKMDTATLKMYKFICNKWDINNNLMPVDLIDEHLYFEDVIKIEVEENPEDFDQDYYSLYYTGNINWDMIDTKYKHNYMLKHKY